MKRLLATTACVALLSITGSGDALAADGDPVIVDTWGKFSTEVKVVKKVKVGSPWGWFPKFYFIASYKDASRADLVRAQVYKGKKKWGKELKCKTKMVWSREGIAQSECQDAGMAINKAGKFKVVITYQSEKTDEKYKAIRTMHFKVAKYNCDSRRGKKSPCFAIDHDFRVGEAVIQRLNPTDVSNGQQMYFSLWFKTRERIKKPKMKCFLNGKKVATAGSRKQASIDHRAYKKGKELYTYYTKFRFFDAMFNWRPQVSKRSGRASDSTFYVTKNPGTYECKVSADGDKVATFWFSVKDQEITPLPCQAGVSMPAGHYVAKAKYEKGINIKHSKKAFAKAPFYGGQAKGFKKCY